MTSQISIPPLPIFDSDEQIGGVTVQTVATHPFTPTKILWVLGRQEKKPSNIKAFKNQPKPAAWQNAGGGMEEYEVEKFLDRFPDHNMTSFAFNEDMTLYDRYVLFGGLREFIDETGYYDIEIFPYFPRYRYDRDDRDDNVSIYDSRLRNGHRAKTLLGHVTSFETRDIVENEEISRAEWFDMAEPLARAFFDRVNFPLYPFFSHVRRLMISIRRAQKMGGYENAPDYCRKFIGIGDKIHPSWRLVFPIGRGVDGFPREGLRLNRDTWYRLFYKMVNEKIEFPDLDLVADLFRAEILEAKNREVRSNEVGELSTTNPYLNEYTSITSGHDNIPVDELFRQDEEYAQWFEESVDLPKSRRLTFKKPVRQ